MKHTHIAAIAAAVAMLTTLLVVPMVAAQKLDYVRMPKPEMVARIRVEGLTLAQLSWIHRLELCESGGDPLAVNPRDKDGTPSYGAFQFKPSTLYYFAKKYGILENSAQEPDYMLYGLQLATVEQMVLHAGEIDWLQQFPDCVKRHVGLPPM